MLEDSLFIRDFENGIVLVNASFTEKSVPLGGVFQKLHGIQDPSVNDGALVSRVIVPGRDGVVLLRAANLIYFPLIARQYRWQFR